MPRILVLDDEPLIAIMLQDWLLEQGFDPVGPAHHVSVALQLIQQEKLDAAILDVSLGAQDCTPVASALRDKGIPFLFLTGYATDRAPKGYLDVPIATKPVDFAALRKILKQLLRS